MEHILYTLVLERREHPSYFAIAVIKHWLNVTYLVYTCTLQSIRGKTGKYLDRELEAGIKADTRGSDAYWLIPSSYSPRPPAHGSCGSRWLGQASKQRSSMVLALVCLSGGLGSDMEAR